jgi:SAM-dependent methyltransferase
MKEAEHRSLRSVEDAHWFYQGKREIAIWWVRYLQSKGLLKGNRVLDVGCGSGALLMKFRDLKFQIAGLEVATAALENLRPEIRGSATQASALELPFRNESVDLVTCFDVIEHIDDHQRAVSEMFRMIKPGGFLLVNVPAFQWLWSDWDTRHGHFRRYNRSGLIEVLQKAGFEIYRCSYENFIGLPPAILVRMLRKCFGKDSFLVENAIPSELPNSMLRWGYVRPATISSFKSPCGLSVWGVARKKDVR